MIEILFLFSLAFLWIIFASVQDLRTREIANWLNFSLIIFALGFRFFYSLFFNKDLSFFYQGLIGLVIFFSLGYLFYFSKIFAGGDAKLMISLGSILPISYDFISNLNYFFNFIFLIFIIGAIYVIFWSIVLSIRHFSEFKKEFFSQLKVKKRIFYFSILFSFLFFLIGLFHNLALILGFYFLIVPLIYFYSKTIENVCMVKKVPVNLLTLGDWLNEDVKIGDKYIRKSWDGLNEKELELLKLHKKDVWIKQGIPFGPVFLISFVLFVFFYFKEFFFLKLFFGF